MGGHRFNSCRALIFSLPHAWGMLNIQPFLTKQCTCNLRLHTFECMSACFWFQIMSLQLKVFNRLSLLWFETLELNRSYCWIVWKLQLVTMAISRSLRCEKFVTFKPVISPWNCGVFPLKMYLLLVKPCISMDWRLFKLLLNLAILLISNFGRHNVGERSSIAANGKL